MMPCDRYRWLGGYSEEDDGWIADRYGIGGYVDPGSL